MGHSYLESWHLNKKTAEEKLMHEKEEAIVIPTEEEKTEYNADSNKEIRPNKKVNTQIKKSSKKSKSNKEEEK